VNVQAVPLLDTPVPSKGPGEQPASGPSRPAQHCLTPVLFTYHLGETVVSVCRSPRPIESDQASIARVAPRLDGGPDDPRSQRYPPWARMLADEEYRALPFILVWSAMVSGFLLVIPGWYFGRLVQRRRWGLGTFLLLPVVVALALVALTTSGPTADVDQVATPGLRLLYSLTILPWWLFPAGLVVRCARRQWWRVAFWLIAAVVISAGIGGYLLATDAGNWTIETRYSWSCWYAVLTFGVYACGLMMVSATAIGWLARAARRRAAKANEGVAKQ